MGIERYPFCIRFFSNEGNGVKVYGFVLDAFNASHFDLHEFDSN